MTTAARSSTAALVRGFGELSRADVDFAGGKGANLGELTAAGMPVPAGFVVGAPAYRAFVEDTGLRERIAELLDGLDVDDTAALQRTAERVRAAIEAGDLPAAVADAIRVAYADLDGEPAVAVRSSATAEDTASASFAGMNETFLNVRGDDAVLDAVRRCWASLFGARTIYYRARRGLPQADMDIAVVVQRQVDATRAGVMFTIDPASGRDDRLVIEGALGLGEAVVSGAVSPDRYVVEKRALGLIAREVRHQELVVERASDGGTAERPATAEEADATVLAAGEIRELARLGTEIERHYGAPQDTEWAIDPEGGVWILQSRPVTAVGGDTAPAGPVVGPSSRDGAGHVLLRGLGAAPGTASGSARIVGSLDDAATLADGEVLVAHMTAPDWVPLMRRAAAIVTDSGGMTCHAAIVSRELGIPCVVGTRSATQDLRDGDLVTVDATNGQILAGAQHGAAQRADRTPPHPPSLTGTSVTGTRLLLNLSEPSQVERAAALPVDGVGLLRAELMILEALGGTHPRRLIEQGRSREFVERMAAALTTFASAFAPRPVTYRTIDFRTNEFRGLEGGDALEPVEANPMIGYRGALRYVREPDLLRLELDAIARVHDAGLRNLHVMLPFVRTERELVACRDQIDAAGLLRRPGFELWVMAEVPSVLFNLERYARLGIAGISIGTNDLTQLLLGADRDSELLADTFDERDPAVVAYLRELIPKARRLGLRTSICGQAPSVHPEYAELLVEAGIDAVSVTVDAAARTRALLAAAERRLLLDAARDERNPR
jgi:pyruvate,water dikinase